MLICRFFLLLWAWSKGCGSLMRCNWICCGRGTPAKRRRSGSCACLRRCRISLLRSRSGFLRPWSGPLWVNCQPGRVAGFGARLLAGDLLWADRWSDYGAALLAGGGTGGCIGRDHSVDCPALVTLKRRWGCKRDDGWTADHCDIGVWIGGMVCERAGWPIVRKTKPLGKLLAALRLFLA